MGEAKKMFLTYMEVGNAGFAGAKNLLKHCIAL